MQTVNQAQVNKKYAAGIDLSPAEDQLISVQNKADELFEKLSNPDLSADMFADLKKQWDDLQETLSAQKTDLGISTEAAEGSIDDLQKKILDLTGQRNSLALTLSTSDSARKLYELQEQINALTGQRDALKLDVQTDETKAKIEELNNQIAALTGQSGAITLDVDTQTAYTKFKDVRSQLDDLKKQLSEKYMQLKIATQQPHASIAAMEERISDLKKQLTMDVTLTLDQQVDIVKEIQKIEKEVKQHKIKIGLETDPSLKDLETMAKQVEKTLAEALAGPKKSSFQMATIEAPNPKDYAALNKEIEQTMNFNDQILEKLEDEKAKYEELGKTGEESYQKILDKMKQLQSANTELAKQAEDNSKNDKKQKKTAKNWEHASDAVISFGDALGSIGDATDNKELNVAGVIAQTLGNLALGTSKAVAEASELGPFGWIAFSIAAFA